MDEPCDESMEDYDACTEEIADMLFAPLSVKCPKPSRDADSIQQDLSRVHSSIQELQEKKISLQSRRDSLLAELATVDTELSTVDHTLEEQSAEKELAEKELKDWEEYQRVSEEVRVLEEEHTKFKKEVEGVLQSWTTALNRERCFDLVTSGCSDYVAYNVKLYLNECEGLMEMLTVFMLKKREHIQKATDRLAKINEEVKIMQALGLAHNLRDMENERAENENIVKVYTEKVDHMLEELTTLEHQVVEVIHKGDFNTLKWFWKVELTYRDSIAHIYSFLTIMEVPSTLSKEEMGILKPLIDEKVETDRLMTGRGDEGD